MKSIDLTIACPCCGRDLDVCFYPGEPAITYGPMENCRPAGPDEWEHDFDSEHGPCDCADYLGGLEGGRSKYDLDVMDRCAMALT